MLVVTRQLGSQKFSINERGIGNGSESWIVKSDQELTAVDIGSQHEIPRRGVSTFPGFSSVICYGLDIAPLGEGKAAAGGGQPWWLYLVTANYRSDVDPGMMASNPLDRHLGTTNLTSVSMSSHKFPVDRFADLDGKPFINSAGDPLEKPPQIEEIERHIRCTRNVAEFKDSEALAFENTINNAQWGDYPSKTAKCASITGEYKYENGVWYWEKTYEFHIKFNRLDSSQFGLYSAWNPFRQLDYGPRSLPSGTAGVPENNRDAQGVGSTVTQLLRANGTRITAQNIRDGEQIHYIEFRNYIETNFNDLGITLPN